MLNINTNLSSLIAQNSLNQSTNKLNTAIERMSTGCKINHAKDNAANYSISTNMTTKIGAYQVAEDNCAMGLDMLATANGTLDQIHDKLQRLRDLATQASNGTYGEDSLKAINSEANALVDEVKRIYSTTEYNGLQFFETEQKYELPANAPKANYNGFIEEVVKRDTSTMTTLASVDADVDLVDGTYSISTPEEMKKLADMTNAGLVSAGDEFVLANDIDLSQYENWTPIGVDIRDSAGNALELRPFMGVFDGNGFSVSNLNIKSTEQYYGALFCRIQAAEVKNLALLDVKINTNKTSSSLVGIGKLSSIIKNCYVTGEISTYNTKCGAGGLIAEAYQGTTIENCYTDCDVSAFNTLGGIVGYSNNSIIKNSFSNSRLNQMNRAILRPTGGLVGYAMTCTIENSSVNSFSETAVGVFVGSTVKNDATSVTVKDCFYNSKYDNFDVDLVRFGGMGAISTDNIQKFSTIEPKETIFQVGINSEKSSQITVKTDFSISQLNGLQNIGLCDSNEIYIAGLDNFLLTLSTKQTEFGAVENRLNSALEEISTQYENLLSSRSTIQDADIAEVSAEYIQQQILQQASATLLATANQSPSIALQLI